MPQTEMSYLNPFDRNLVRELILSVVGGRISRSASHQGISKAREVARSKYLFASLACRLFLQTSDSSGTVQVYLGRIWERMEAGIAPIGTFIETVNEICHTTSQQTGWIEGSVL